MPSSRFLDWCPDCRTTYDTREHKRGRCGECEQARQQKATGSTSEGMTNQERIKELEERSDTWWSRAFERARQLDIANCKITDLKKQLKEANNRADGWWGKSDMLEASCDRVMIQCDRYREVLEQIQELAMVGVHESDSRLIEKLCSAALAPPTQEPE